MAYWRRTAVAVSNQFLIDIEMTTEAIQAINVARGHFAMAAEAYARYRLGLPNPPLDGDGDALPNLMAAIDRVSFALARTMNLSTYHAGLGHIFSIGAARLGLKDTARLWWEKWEYHHADAAAHADMALQRLRSARSHNGAARDVVNLMRESSLQLRYAWGPAAEQLLRRAADDLDIARAALEQMRLAVVTEFSDAWMLLSR
jgi:hypothetical protein